MIDIKDINVLILAGGKGSRMNYCNKALLKYNNTTFLGHLSELFSDFSKIYLSLNSSQNIITDSFIRVDDDFKDIGPISGLYKGILESDLEYIFTVPCDVPNLNKEFINYISSFVSPYYDAFIVRDKNGFIHPLLGVYNKSCLSIIKESIKNEDYKILNIINKLNVRFIDLKYTIFDDNYILKNINTFEDYNTLNKKTKFFAVSGIKNSGKTTLITKLLEKFKENNYKVGTIKHDGHDFQMDNLDSDTDRHIKSGAQGTLIFSKSKYMFLENSLEKDLDFYLDFFKDYDFIILEGFKGSSFPKIEVIRKEISNISQCNKENLLFYVSDLNFIENNENLDILDINDIDSILKKIKSFLKKDDLA
ncbi:molybdopterin-guanine dinucleotide biosynthesis protein B [Candidatus Cetobacterium colombiensis]|uniref:Probable molybdenum cofactor guanylyltransferase n=1 Tax=Candidatus Cetobacterium colombiensis TaxID=3073100 RepID=A0ABU4WBU6_9FUSO|nr:molybdopterin-guanine dinucleotide biosynthesis protein B [Candidatus Cetobacterium colombiensis]MDX8336036.1 molybdopterin-guanine dinucleotide biosynthesis protein B [Candidatus Cetobacterium colombiensis]